MTIGPWPFPVSEVRLVRLVRLVAGVKSWLGGTNGSLFFSVTLLAVDAGIVDGAFEDSVNNTVVVAALPLFIGGTLELSVGLAVLTSLVATIDDNVEILKGLEAVLTSKVSAFVTFKAKFLTSVPLGDSNLAGASNSWSFKRSSSLLSSSTSS